MRCCTNIWPFSNVREVEKVSMQMSEEAMSKERETLFLNAIVGSLSQQEIADRVHDAGHQGVVEYIDLNGDDIRRHRLRATTDRGTDCAIAVPRSSTLESGAVLLLEERRAIVVRMQARAWLRLAAADTAAALELGYFAGNMHWPVRFDDGLLLIELQGPPQRYLERLDLFLKTGQISVIEDKAG
jgi:urease accessory protein